MHPVVADLTNGHLRSTPPSPAPATPAPAVPGPELVERIPAPD